MAQKFNIIKFIDVDNTVVKPSPQRIRNILTLDEKIAVIKAYEQRPMYKKVARMFNCSWEQIKNIITNRVAIMEFYHAAKKKTKNEDEIEKDIQMDLKQKKIKFLGECVYECIRRLQYHSKIPLSEELIRHKALEFLDVFRIPGFSPTRKWINLFKSTYNITLSNKQVYIYTEPQSSLDIKDIMNFCTKARTSKNLLKNKYKKYDEKIDEYETKRLRKLNFLQEALKEYLLRVKFHHKSMKLDTDALRRVAIDFNEILKVQDFEPSVEWIESFRRENGGEECLGNVKRPPLSLDLKDILSYCSRMQNKTKDNTITLTPKESALQMRVLPKYPDTNLPETGLKFQQNSIIYLDEEAEEKDIKPNINKIRVQKCNLNQPPLKIRKIESINNDPDLRQKIPVNMEILTKVHSPKEHVACVTPQTTGIKVKEETLNENNYILPTNTIAAKSELKIQHVHQLVSSSGFSPVQHHTPPKPSSHYSNDPHSEELPRHVIQHHSPHTYSSSYLNDTDSVELPRHVTNFNDVLLLLKPLEEYAMLKENYRAIGLITQLEEVLKNEPEDSTGDEEFIG